MTWVEKTKQGETWDPLPSEQRTFSPFTFSRLPVFDTGSIAGIWDVRSKQTETWTPEP